MTDNEKYGWGNAPDETVMPYIQACNLIISDPDEFKKFRRNPDYGKILSGGEKIVGEVALKSIKELGGYKLFQQNLLQIKESDSVGTPFLHDYPELGLIDPSTIRYFNTAIEIMQLLGGCHKPKKIIEIGGGYGGLCRMLSIFYNFEEYIIVDLPQAVLVAEKWLSHFPTLKGRVKFIPCDKISDREEFHNVDLFVADSSLAECNLKTQNIYIDTLAHDAKFHYVIWNTLYLPNGVLECENYLKHFKNSHKCEIKSLGVNIYRIYLRKKSCLVLWEKNKQLTHKGVLINNAYCYLGRVIRRVVKRL